MNQTRILMLLLRSHTLLVLKGYRDKQARWHVAVPKAPGWVTARWLETELPGSVHLLAVPASPLPLILHSLPWRISPC